MDKPKSDNLVRLNKFIADSGVASRRKADDLIAGGAVQVNGKTIYELGVKVHPVRDRITVSGKPVKPVHQRLYVAFYKPENVLTSMSDPQGRPTVNDYVTGLPVRVFPVGRLDWDTEGLLLLTNDGDFAQKISHPKTAIPKTYLAKLNAVPTQFQLEKLRRGVTIPGGKAAALKAERAYIGDSEKYAWVKIIITEGRNRQVRKMFEKVGLDVKKLKRIAIGKLEIGPLKKGKFLFLGPRGVAEALSSDLKDLPKRSPKDARSQRAEDFQSSRSTRRPGKPPRGPRKASRSLKTPN